MRNLKSLGTEAGEKSSFCLLLRSFFKGDTHHFAKYFGKKDDVKMGFKG